MGAYAAAERGQKIASGGSADIFEWSAIGAIQAIAKCAHGDDAAKAAVRREASTLLQISSPAVPRFLGYQSHPSSAQHQDTTPWLILEKKPGQSLDLIFADLQAEQQRDIFIQCCVLLLSLHRGGLRHGDIKAENFLYDPKTAQISLIDFGLSAPFTDPPLGGTPALLAPEISDGEQGPQAEVYSLAATFSEFFAPGCMRLSPERRIQAIHAHATSLSKLLVSMLHPQPTKRPTLEEAIEHLWPNLTKEQQSRAADHAGITVHSKPELFSKTGSDPRAASTAARYLTPADNELGMVPHLRLALGEAIAQDITPIGGCILDGSSGQLDVLYAHFKSCSDIHTLTELLRRTCHQRRQAVFIEHVPTDSPLDKFGIDFVTHPAQISQSTPTWFQSGGRGAPKSPALSEEDFHISISARFPLKPIDREQTKSLHTRLQASAAKLAQLLQRCSRQELIEAIQNPNIDSLFEQQVIDWSAYAEPEQTLLTAFFALPYPPAIPWLQTVLDSDAVLLIQRSIIQGALSQLGIVQRQKHLSSTRTLQKKPPPRAHCQRLLQRLEAKEDIHSLLVRAKIATWYPELVHDSVVLEAAQSIAPSWPNHALALIDARLGNLNTEAPEHFNETYLVPLLLQKASLLRQIGQAEQALAILKKAPLSPAITIEQAHCELELGNYAEGIAHLKNGNALEAAPALGARLYLLLGQPQKIVDLLNADHNAHLKAGQNEYGQNKADQNERVQCLRTLGLAYYQLGQLDEALAILQQAQQLIDEHADASGLDGADRNPRPVTTQTQGLLASSLAMVAQKTGHTELAEQMYAQSILCAQAEQDLRALAVRLINRATFWQDAHHYRSAIDDLRRAKGLSTLIEGERELRRAAIFEANLLYWLGALEEATQCSQALLEHLSSGSVEFALAELLHIQILIAEARTGPAELRLTKLKNRLPKDHGVIVEYAWTQTLLAARHKDWVEVEKKAAYATERAADYRRYRLQLCAMLMHARAHLEIGTHRYAQAKQIIAEALHLESKHPDLDVQWRLRALYARLSKKASDWQWAELAYTTMLDAIPARYEQTYRWFWTRKPQSDALDQHNIAHQQAKTVQRLLAFNRQLARAADPTSLLNHILDVAIELGQAERGLIAIRTDPSEDLRIHTARHGDSPAISEVEIQFSRSIAEETIRSDSAVYTFDAKQDPRFANNASVHHLELSSVLCLPLRSTEGVYGALYLDRKGLGQVLSSAQVQLLEAFADQASLTFTKAQTIADLEARQQKLEDQASEIKALNARLLNEWQDDAHPEAVESMVGDSPPMQRLKALLTKIAPRDINVLIYGPSGSGKELIAKALHQASGRPGHFVSINCGAMAQNLIESELFGHVRGAFTGADRDKVGLLERAENGTLFLDEIAELPLIAQVKLLRVLQERRFRAVGGLEVKICRARILSATHQNLEQATREGRFREDLWYRINTIELAVPPLKERKEDIPALAQHFLHQINSTQEITKHFTTEALRVLSEHHWPGNIRQLENEIRRAALLSQGGVIEISDLSIRPNPSGPGAQSLKSQVQIFEIQAIHQAIQTCRGNMTQTAAQLGLTRAALYKKMAKLGIDKRSAQ